MFTQVKKQDGLLIARCQVADSFFSRFRGLMFRSTLNEDEAVLFPKCNSIHTFFMRFPIDVVFISSHGQVVDTVADLRPWRLLWPRLNAKHTLELKAGRTKALSIQTGEMILCEGVWGESRRSS